MEHAATRQRAAVGVPKAAVAFANATEDPFSFGRQQLPNVSLGPSEAAVATAEASVASFASAYTVGLYLYLQEKDASMKEASKRDLLNAAC